MKIWGGFEFWFESLWNIRSEYAIRFVLSFKVKVFFNLICPWFRIFTSLAFILSKICSSLWMRYPVLTHTFNNHLWTIQIDTKFHWFRVLYTYICWFDQYAVREKKLKFSSDGLKKKKIISIRCVPLDSLFPPSRDSRFLFTILLQSYNYRKRELITWKLVMQNYRNVILTSVSNVWYEKYRFEHFAD